MALSANERMRYQRHLSLAEIGVAGQERLKRARVLVIGSGGLGCPAALYLAAAGIGTLGIVDFDRVEASNLQRQVLFASVDVGRAKVDVARERLLALNPEITVLAHELMLRADNVCDVFDKYDVIVDGSDRPSTRYLVNDACVLRGKPLVMAAIHRFEGQAMTYVPGRGPCYRCLFPEGGETLAQSCADAGVLGVLPGVLGTLQASEALKLAAGIGVPLTGRLLTYDALELTFTQLPVSRRGDCPVCGDSPTITVPRDLDRPEICDGSSSARRFSAMQLRDLMASPPSDRLRIVLVDVRESREFEIRHLAGARNIPLGELERRIDELSDVEQPIFLCRSGRRSLAACAIALRFRGHTPGHLEGGLLAWAAEVDPDFEVAEG